MCDTFPAGKGWNASLIVTLRHLPAFSTDACFSSKPSFRYTSSRTLKVTQPPGSTTRMSSSSASGGAWFLVKTPHRDGGREGAGVETQGLTQHHAVQAAVHILFAGLVEHTLRDVYPHEVLVAEHAKYASEQARTHTGIQHPPPERNVSAHEPGRHGGYRVAQAQHVVFIIFRPLVVSARQLTVVAGRVNVL